MGWISPNRHGFLRICFRWQGVECREGTKLKNTPANRKLIQQRVNQIQYEIDHGLFEYRRHFPHGTKARRFEAGGRSTPI